LLIKQPARGSMLRLRATEAEHQPSGDARPTPGLYDCIIVDEAHRGYVLDAELRKEDLAFRTSGRRSSAITSPCFEAHAGCGLGRASSVRLRA